MPKMPNNFQNKILNCYIIQIIIEMNMEEMLRQQNYQLKNEITDLKNAFDLNRDILKILSTHNYKADPQHNLFMHIIIRLTNVNNLAMISNTEFLFEKNVLKQQNWRLNQEIKMLQLKLKHEITLNSKCNEPTFQKLTMQQQLNKLNKEITLSNEQQIIKQQQILQSNKNQQRHQTQQKYQKSFKQFNSNLLTKRIESNIQYKYEILYNQSLKEINKLKLYIQQLQYRLLIMIKAHRIKQQTLINKKKGRRSNKHQYLQYASQIKLLKYALNDIQVQKKQEEYILTITERFKDKDKFNQPIIKQKNRKSNSWPKKITTKNTNKSEQSDSQQIQIENRITQRFY